MSSLSLRLEAEKIKIVCCIDDENARKGLQSLAAVAAAMVQMSPSEVGRLRERNSSIASLLDTVEGEDAITRSDELTILLNTATRDETFTEIEVQQAVSESLEMEPAPDSISAKLKSVFAQTETEFRTLSFKDWDRDAKDILSATTQDNRVLLLVDRRNDSEGDTYTDGTNVLANLFMNFVDVCDFVDCVVITSSVEPANELVASHEIYKVVHGLVRQGSQGKARKVFVLAKDRLSKEDEEIQGEFLVHFDRLKAARLGRRLAFASRKILESAVSEATDWLEEVSLPEFHWSVFRSSEQEGASEIQTLLRLVSLKQGLKLEREFPSNHEIVEAIKGLRLIPRENVAHSASPQELEAMRKLEFEREGAHINKLRQPIMCGDVFSITGLAGDGRVTTREAILLGNPCDFTIRSSGKRIAKFGLLVIIDRATKADIVRANALENGTEDLAKLAIVFKTGEQPSDTQYTIRPNKVETIPLEILDLVWTNDDGKAIASSNSARLASDMLSPAQVKVANKIKSKDKKSYPKVELFGISLKPEVTSENAPGVGQVNTAEYNIKRTWRLTEEYAAAALLAFSQAMSRPAFGHDFLRGWEIRNESIT